MRRSKGSISRSLVIMLALGLVAEVAEAQSSRRAAQIEYAGRGSAAVASAPAARSGQPSAARNMPAPTGALSYRYPDQPDVEYGATTPVSAAPQGPRIILRGVGEGPQTDAAPTVSSSSWANALTAAASAPGDVPRQAGAAPAPSAQRHVQARAAVRPVQATERPAWLEPERVGAPYTVNGRTYVPTPEPDYAETGVASYYGDEFHGRRTASGETYDREALSAAHPTLPIPSLVQITNLSNGREVIVRVNDRGPFHGDRLIDVSRRTAEVLGFTREGHARVHVRYLGPAPRRVAGVPNSGEGAALDLRAPQADRDVAFGQATDLNSAPVPQSEPTQPRPAPQRLPAPASGFVVQVGAFSELANAERVRAAVRSVGVVTVEPRTVQGSALYRVQVGPWGDAEAAENARAALTALGFTQARVTQTR